MFSDVFFIPYRINWFLHQQLIILLCAFMIMLLILGIIRFTQAVKMYEKQDQEITILNRELRSILIPSMNECGPEGAS